MRVAIKLFYIILIPIMLRFVASMSDHKHLQAKQTTRTRNLRQMAEPRLLINAPIQEAVIDIRVECADSVEQSSLQSIHGMLENYSPFEVNIQRGIGVKFEQDGVSTTHEESFLGYKTENVQRNFIIQFQTTGLSVSKAQPYIDWDDFKEEAVVAWNLYKAVLPKYKITRLAVRFINRIELPLSDSFQFEDYLHITPQIPEKLGNSVAGFFNRLVVPRPALSAAAIIIQNVESPDQNGYLPVILDIDVFRDSNMSDIEAEMWNVLDGLREIKNQAFFGSVKERTLELFE